MKIPEWYKTWEGKLPPAAVEAIKKAVPKIMAWLTRDDTWAWLEENGLIPKLSVSGELTLSVGESRHLRAVIIRALWEDEGYKAAGWAIVANARRPYRDADIEVVGKDIPYGADIFSKGLYYHSFDAARDSPGWFEFGEGPMNKTEFIDKLRAVVTGIAAIMMIYPEAGKLLMVETMYY